MAANLRYKKRLTAVQIAEAASRAEEIRNVLSVVDLDQGIEGAAAPIDLFHLAQLAETIICGGFAFALSYTFTAKPPTIPCKNNMTLLPHQTCYMQLEIRIPSSPPIPSAPNTPRTL